MRLAIAAMASMISVQIHWTARNLTSDASEGKSMLKTTISWGGNKHHKQCEGAHVGLQKACN